MATKTTATKRRPRAAAAPPAPEAAEAEPAAPPAAKRARKKAAPAAKKAAPAPPAKNAAPAPPVKKSAVKRAAKKAPPASAEPSRLRLSDGDLRHIVWQAGSGCPDPLADAARACTGDAGQLAIDDDDAVPRLLHLAAETGHPIEVDDAVWPHLAAGRDMRRRLALLQAAYPSGEALQGALRVALAPYQAEGALWAVVAGRALLADERGLGKGVQAIAAARLWLQHFGLQRVLVLCAAAQRAAWQRAWQRVAGVAAQVLDAPAHQRAALWRSDAAVRIAGPDALAGDAAQRADWAPQLLIVDEPQLLGLHAQDWAALDAPYAIVLCGAALDTQPALLNTLVEWLDCHRLGPLAALREVQAARARGDALAEPEVERLDAQLSRILLQRQRGELAAILPPRICCERLLALGAAQREAHDRAFVAAQRILAGWRSSGWLADADQWQLGLALRAMRSACHRADPLDAAGALAETTLSALQSQLDDWAAGGTSAVALCCATDADRAQLVQRLGTGPGLVLLGPDEPVPADCDAVLRVGVPWRCDAPGTAPRGQVWMLLVAQDSIDSGLFETLATRRDTPSGPDEGAGLLEGDALRAWLSAVDAALDASTASAA